MTVVSYIWMTSHYQKEIVPMLEYAHLKFQIIYAPGMRKALVRFIGPGQKVNVAPNARSMTILTTLHMATL